MTVPITLTNLVNLQNETTAVTEINNNSTAITTAFGSSLDTAGDKMQGNLDMNSNHVLNLPNPATANEPLRLQDLSTFVGAGTVTNIPAGGTTGQVLTKTNNTNYAVNWGNSVTSVGLSLPSDFTISNSPVTSSGTLAGAWVNTPTGTGAVVRATSPTITTPNISSIVNTGTLTLPTSSDTLVGRATTDTLTNKTLTNPQLSTTAPTAQAQLGFSSVNNSLNYGDGTTNHTVASLDQTQTITNKTISGASNTLSNVALSSLASEAASTIVGNFTTSSAVPTASTIGSLTSKASPAGTDLILIADQAASGQLKQATIASIASAGSVASIAGNTGAFTLSHGITNSVNDIRLALNNATIETAITNPTGVTAFVMLGMGTTATLTPVYSGRIFASFMGSVTNSVTGNFTNLTLRYGTGTPPANGAAATGTIIGGIVQIATFTANLNSGFNLSGLALSLTPGTAYWFDLSASPASGTSTITNVSFSAYEF